MKHINLLLEIANFLKLEDIVKNIENIKERSSQSNATLLLPLVGEFSSGKTTLINALTDCKKLETATRPTTSTIYEVHFGSSRCYANVLNANGQLVEVENLSDLKNEFLTDSIGVKIFDTSTRVPSTTVLVDTPGLSSSDPRHKQTLVDFLPQADAVLLVTDINQQITRTLTDFIDTMKLAKRPIFLVITKCDTKSSQELEQAKEYIGKNCNISIQQIACVSATQNNLQELYTLLDEIQKEKTHILEQVDKQRIKNIIKIMLEHIDNLLQASSSDKELNEAISRQEYELKLLNRNIDKLIEETKDDIKEKEKIIIRKFEDSIFDKLDRLVMNKSDNFDNEALSVINNISSLSLNNYKSGIQEIIYNKIQERKNKENAVYLHSLKELDLSSLTISGLNYNINLNSIGHEYDGMIAIGTKVAAAAAVVCIGAAALSAGASGAGALGAGDMISMADTASDVSSIIANKKAANRIENAANFIEKTDNQFDRIDNRSQKIGQQIGTNNGIVESMVGFVTDKTMGKPQRKRAIRNYMDESLIPDFNQAMNNISKQLISTIASTLRNEAKDTITMKTNTLEQLKNERQEKKDIYEQKMKQLRDYKNELIIL